MVVTESVDHIFTRRITTRFTDDLPLGEILIRVHYSSVNYKDALSASGNRGVTIRFVRVAERILTNRSWTEPRGLGCSLEVMGKECRGLFF